MNPYTSVPVMYNYLILLFMFMAALAWYLGWCKGKRK